MAKLRERILGLKEQRISSDNSTWDDCEPTVYLLKRDVLGALDAEAALRQQTPAVGEGSVMKRTAEQVVQERRDSGSQDWGDLVSRINYWAVTDMCPALAAQTSPETGQPDTPPTPREAAMKIPLKDYGLVPHEDKCCDRFYAEGQTLLCQKPIGHAGWHESGDYEWETQSLRKVPQEQITAIKQMAKAPLGLDEAFQKWNNSESKRDTVFGGFVAGWNAGVAFGHWEASGAAGQTSGEALREALDGWLSKHNPTGTTGNACHCKNCDESLAALGQTSTA